ncbi:MULTISPECIES: hypothetical protein [Imperialibacter]|jgi:anti-sigma factor RsiW|uniref:Uncharacterized protein n=1 Tax=Imperialibacter roseus TaxID=1324217 RepID=A0ABZ0IP57_9BACT|nr:MULTISPECIES: hypothetical protein [Imperialibacter]WOK06356.1 hypothetical protein RT717_25095 [Imperialibacter roseus]CAD5267639.1 conserved hypothetical protein [Imperialibacter sp. 89]CAD5296072.1 conserved hypothetical protein [Imperialibacter sp. 75]VVT33724.1 conserved hypothetical protein [Imperialibacter sp. EC-SDR9]|tara:strand:- start:507 stop:746 length:240 start_codon:yes stop_codon:yes gene_type:complete
MTKTFTENDLIRYVYGETSEIENNEIESALLCDSEVQEQFAQLIEITQQLSCVDYFPSENSVKNILDKAKELNLQSIAK